MYDTTRLAVALRLTRAASRLTQKELAKELAVSKTVIARNEKPDMAMRADTLMRLVYVMGQHNIHIDVFSTLDAVLMTLTGEDLSSATMRTARASLHLNQQDFADLLGVGKSIVTRGERPGSMMPADINVKMREIMRKKGVRVDWSPMHQILHVNVHREALAQLDARRQGKSLPGEHDYELTPTELHEKLSGAVTLRYRAEKRDNGAEDAPESDKT